MKLLPNLLREIEAQTTLIQGLRVLLTEMREQCRNNREAKPIDDALMNLDKITAALEKNLSRSVV